MPAPIVVGIASTNRNREMMPAHWAAGLGEPDAFLDYLQNELMPLIDARYDTAPYRILCGHSLGGTLALQAAFARPNLFDAFAILSPSLARDDGTIARMAAAYADQDHTRRKRFFLCIANEEGSWKAYRSIVKSIDQLDCFDAQIDSIEFGASVSHTGSLVRGVDPALRSLFRAWMPHEAWDARDVDAIVAHYEDAAQRYGFQARAPHARHLRKLAGYLHTSGRFVDEVRILELNIEQFPDNAHNWMTLAQARRSAGLANEAFAAVEEALRLQGEVGLPGSDPGRYATPVPPTDPEWLLELYWELDAETDQDIHLRCLRINNELFPAHPGTRRLLNE